MTDQTNGNNELEPSADKQLGASSTNALDVIGAVSAAGADPTADEAYAKLKERRAERRRKKIRRRVIAGVVVLAVVLLAVGATILLSRQPEQNMEPVTDAVTRGTFTTEVDAKGSLQPLSSTVATSEVDGTIAEVRVAEGQAVKKGDVLFTVKSDAVDQSVDAAAKALNSAKASQKDAYNAYNQQVDAYNADDSGMASLPDKSTLSAADSAVAQAQEDYNQVVADADAKRQVRAQSDGTVITMNAKVGAMVGPRAQTGTDPLVQVADLSQMKVRIQVDEKSIEKVARDQAATITFPALEGVSLAGTVTNIASISSTATDAGSYDGGGSGVTYAVDVLIPQPDPRLKSGMTAQVSLTIEKIDDALMVPVMALQSDDGEHYYVNVETDASTHAYEQRDVTVKTRNDDLAVVEPGSVDEGDVLVISGGMSADDGSGSTGAAAADGEVVASTDRPASANAE